MRQASTRSTGLEPGSSADESFNFLLQHFGWQNRDVPPRMLVGIWASLRAVLDLTKPANILPHPEYGASHWIPLDASDRLNQLLIGSSSGWADAL
jgi:hypothetical protein